MPMPKHPSFTAEDAQAAFDGLCPHIECLVKRFGAAQAFEIVDDAVREACHGYPTEPPKFVRAPQGGNLSRWSYH
jgi:hypothetical protein